MDWTQLITQALGLVAIAVAGWITRKVTTPSSQQKAQLLASIARDAAALVVAGNPGLKWPEILQLVVNQISTAAGLNDVTDRAAIERAAAGALWTIGKRP